MKSVYPNYGDQTYSHNLIPIEQHKEHLEGFLKAIELPTLRDASRRMGLLPTTKGFQFNKKHAEEAANGDTSKEMYFTLLIFFNIYYLYIK